MTERWVTAISKVWLWAFGPGLSGILLTTAGYISLYLGLISNYEAIPFIMLGEAGIIAAIVLAILARIAKRVFVTS